MPPHRSYRVKLGRAEEHLNALDAAVQRFAETNPFEVYSEPDDTGFEVFRVRWTAQPPPECQVLAGDALFNLKCALDHLIYDISARHATAGFNERVPAFPIHENEEAFREFGARRIRYLPPAAQAVVEQLQPFRQAPRDDSVPDHLLLLDGLHERDKHREIRVVNSAVMGAGAEFHDDGGRCWALESLKYASEAYRNGMEIFRVRPRSPRCSGPERAITVHLLPGISFDQPPAQNKPVGPVIRWIMSYVREHVIGQLEPFL